MVRTRKKSLRLRSSLKNGASDPCDKNHVGENRSEEVSVDTAGIDEHSRFSTEDLVLSLPQVSPSETDNKDPKTNEGRHESRQQGSEKRRNFVSESSDDDFETRDSTYRRSTIRTEEFEPRKRTRSLGCTRTDEAEEESAHEKRRRSQTRQERRYRSYVLRSSIEDSDLEEFRSEGIRDKPSDDKHSNNKHDGHTNSILVNNRNTASPPEESSTDEAVITLSRGRTDLLAASPRQTQCGNSSVENRKAQGRSFSRIMTNADTLNWSVDIAGGTEDLGDSDVEVSNTSEIRERINDCALMDGTFFKVCDTITDTDRVPVRCQLCADKKKLIGSFSVSTNLVKHLKRHHETDHGRYLEHKKEKAEEKRKRKRRTGSGDALPSAKRPRRFRQFGIEPKDFEDRVLKFIIDTMSPLSITDHPSFKGLFEGMNVNPVNRRKLTKRLVDVDSKRFAVTKELLSQADYVCSTADIWSAKRRSFIGVTCHYIDREFTRHSLPLACRRFKGTHSYDRIAEILSNVHNEHGLGSQKIVATVTDNARNFVKAFQEFAVRPDEIQSEAEGCDSDDSCTSSFEAVSIQHTLPHHLRCSSHTLNLIASTDLMNAIKENDSLYRRHTNTIAKCSKIWHKAALPKFAEIIIGTVGHTFSYPVVTRWNSLYDSLKQILKEIDSMPLLFERLQLTEGFTPGETLYMTEYCQVMAPIAQALDILQGETKAYYGMLLPTLITLRIRIEKLARSNLRYGKVLTNACLNGLTRRFDDIFSANDNDRSLLATISHPKFKLKWLDETNSKFNLGMNISRARDRFMEEASFGEPQSLSDCTERSVDSLSSFFRLEASQGTDFFSQDNATQPSNSKDVQGQLTIFLNDKRTQLSMLEDYPAVKRLFVKFNTPLPSSAPVERLFSFASIANAPRRHALTDKNFERIVLLKAFFKSGHELD